MSELTRMIRTHYDGNESGDLDLALSVYDADVEVVTPSGPMRGVAALRAFGEAFQTAVPNSRHEILHSYETGDTIIIEGIYSGTQTGALVGPDGTLPPTGRDFALPYVDVLTARDGKFVTHHIYWDNVTFMTQLGLMPTPQAAAV